MRILHSFLLATALFSGNAMAQAIPPAALNPTAPVHALSVDSKLPADTALTSDAATLAGIAGTTVKSDYQKAQDKVTEDKATIERLTGQVSQDIHMKVNRQVLSQDKSALSDARKQLSLDTKACLAILKASGEKVDARVNPTPCR